MKRILAILLSALLLMTCLSGFAVLAEDGVTEETVTPVYLIDGEDLNVIHGFNNCEGTYNYDEGYIRLTATGEDPYYHLMVEEPPVEVAPWLAIKYRTTCSMEGQMFASQFKPAREDCSFEVTYGTSGEWCVDAYHLPSKLSLESLNPDTNETEVGYDPETNLLGWLRYDFGVAEGDWVEIEYIAFFDSVEDVYAYEHTLPTPPAPPAVELPYDQEDGAQKTFVLDSEDFLAKIDWYNQAEATVGDGNFITFTATDADPYFVFKDADVGVTGKQASYFVIKYRTEATSQEATKIEAYSAIFDGPSWGNATHAEAELTPDGEWHYVLMDASDSLGNYEKGLHSFRIDVLAAAEAGETIDIAVLKLFDDLADVKGFFELRAGLGDALAQTFLDENPIEIPEPGTDTETESDTESDTETNTESDTESDTEVNTDSETESDTEVDTDSDTESVSDTVSVDTDTEAVDADSDTETATATGAATEDTTEAEASGCKSVIASASVLAVVAMAAGAVVCKKRNE